MAEKISSRLMQMEDAHAERNIRILFEATQADLTALRARIAAIDTALTTIIATAGTAVTGTSVGAAYTPVVPAALTLLR
jgi:hypothetical protein